MKVYLFTFGLSFGSREEAKAILNKCSSVKGWRTDMMRSFYLKSEESADTIAKEIREHKKTGRFIVVEITDNSQGWIQKDSWKFINDEKNKK
ncbi:hypothetical protein L6468_00760 [Prevotella communis]|uniref:hypothetical protein n=1 Tax=Prevotella communis TaxID=2913614 RepID=UPI001EDB8249|nr:hypothetical protein [Prevotella communis]UKK62340.1 hypothetical protein L6468_00760 [Prevotella communis]UKK65167.1 hypothetical protein L6473_00760 [Prevotella communis]